MDSWDLTTLDIEVHKPEVLRSEEGAARAIAINLPAGDMLQDHEVHEHAYLVVVAGELEIESNRPSPAAPDSYVLLAVTRTGHCPAELTARLVRDAHK